MIKQGETKAPCLAVFITTSTNYSISPKHVHSCSNF